MQCLEAGAASLASKLHTSSGHLISLNHNKPKVHTAYYRFQPPVVVFWFSLTNYNVDMNIEQLDKENVYTSLFLRRSLKQNTTRLYPLWDYLHL